MRVGHAPPLLACLLVAAACGSDEPSTLPASSTSDDSSVAAAQVSLVGDGTLDPKEECDDGNAVSGDGCSAAGRLEGTHFCHVPGRPCSLRALCGNGALDSGEACDDARGASVGCTSDCDLSDCGNGTLENKIWPSYAQETCDDGNRVGGDGCSALCQVEPFFGCEGEPSRCLVTGVNIFNTGVDDLGHRVAEKIQSGVETATDPHWQWTTARRVSTGTTRQCNPGGQHCRLVPSYSYSYDVVLGKRTAHDWPQEIMTARFVEDASSLPNCVRQSFNVPSTVDRTRLRLHIATFNDNRLESISVNGRAQSLTQLSERTPQGGQDWQKSIVHVVRPDAGWLLGRNTITICNDNHRDNPNAFRYVIVDSYDDACGDGLVSEREQCDDGNATVGDGCDASCDLEPGYACAGEPSACARTCGNGIINASEECDDGNLKAGDGCSSTCRVEAGYTCAVGGAACLPICGDGVVVPGEQCDDGNALPGDGCLPTCRIQSDFACSGSPSVCERLCGNGRVDASYGEQCDDGNRKIGDGCSPACTLELGYACPTEGAPCLRTCGNGALDAGEECDDGNLASSDGCNSECDVESGYVCSSAGVCRSTCGNGSLDTGEGCDDGNTDSFDGCSDICVVEPGYGCDASGRNCVSSCGDGVLAGNEACDDTRSPAADGDGCSATCTVEPGYICDGTACTMSCGNGIVDIGEACDDGNTAASDGCSPNCIAEPGFHCTGQPSACNAICGDGIVTSTEGCDDGNVDDADACDNTCKLGEGQSCTGPGTCKGVCNVAAQTCAARDVCGNGAREGAEACDDGNATSGDGCDAFCLLEPGAACDPARRQCTGVCNPVSLRCDVLGACGNGYVESDEACDDGDRNDGNACSNSCRVHTGESCPVDPSGCVGVCNPIAGLCAEKGVCGNGVSEAGEACDDGGTTSGDGCSATCLLEVGRACSDDSMCNGVCNPTSGLCAAPDTCPNGVLESGEACDDGNLNNSDACTNACLRTVGETCVSGAQCDGVCNGYVGQCAAYGSCGNGVIDNPGVEFCDDGGRVDGDGCSASCLLEDGATCAKSAECVGVCDPANGRCAPALSCGNGVVEPGEVCDDGNADSSDACTNTCRLGEGQACAYDRQCDGLCNPVSRACAPLDVCGNGVPEGSEGCDDGNRVSGDGCGTTCLLENRQPCADDSECEGVCNPSSQLCAGANACPNGVVETGEVCDDGNGNEHDGCSNTCRLTEGQLCAASAECEGVCNPATQTCDIALACGNGVRELDEVCDDGNWDDLDGCTTLCLRTAGEPCTLDDECDELCNSLAGVCAGYGVCGNGHVEEGEACDDGNSNDGDGCSNRCLRQDGASCTRSNECVGLCNPAALVCAAPQSCGNGFVEFGESCDDGNAVDGDGCDISCLREAGEPCKKNAQCAGVCNLVAKQCALASTCTNGVVEMGEACDDGNQVDDDGCSNACLLGYGQSCVTSDQCDGVCNPTTSKCAPADSCPNGVVDAGEECDDGDDNDFDECSNACLLGVGLACATDDECAGVCNPASSLCAPGNLCGNGRLEAGEACDDGNGVDSDGCTNACLLASGESCRVTEECVGVCNPYTFVCAPEAVCTNGVQDPGEACDDGNLVDDDHCSNACKRDNGELCADDEECVGVCDLALNEPVCRAAGTCPNGTLDPGEACDDGNDVDDDACSNACVRGNGSSCAVSSQCVEVCNVYTGECRVADVCGNGVLEGGEACDDGNVVDDDACSNSCRLGTDEPCTSSDECEGICNPAMRLCAPVNVCGNGTIEPGEVCDDGDSNDRNACTNACLLGVGAACSQSSECAEECNPALGECAESDVCGNGVLDAGEACDDGNFDELDGCDGFCRRTAGQTCAASFDCAGVCNPVALLCADVGVCGNGLLDSGEACDDGNTQDDDDCTNGCLRTFGVACASDDECLGVCNPAVGTCAAVRTCPNGLLEPGEVCDDGNADNGDACSSSCMLGDGEPCTGFAQCAGVCNTTTDRCAAADVCGNGVTEAGEACDDGNSVNGDGCSSQCTLPIGATCRENGDCSSSLCNPSSRTCATPQTCGNGVVESGEFCDDGDRDDANDCDNGCLLGAGSPCTASEQCAGVCNPVRGLCAPADFCTNGIVERGEACDDGDLIDVDHCTNNCLRSVGELCDKNTQCTDVCNRGLGLCDVAGRCGNGVVEEGEACDDGDGFDSNACTNLCLKGIDVACSDSTECEGVCDVAIGLCAPEGVCGNGVVEGSEPCDDGDGIDDNECSNSCLRGDGETCDYEGQCEGVCNSSTRLCAPFGECGNGVIDAAFESCDDGNDVDDDECSNVCLRGVGEPCSDSLVCDQICNRLRGKCEALGVCGNGAVEDGEACDDGDGVDDNACSNDCRRAEGQACWTDRQCVGVCNDVVGLCADVDACGNGRVEANEACDDGNSDDSDACSNACLRGTGVACASSDRCTGVCNFATRQCALAGVCGNGVVETGETCDDGNLESGDGCEATCKPTVTPEDAGVPAMDGSVPTDAGELLDAGSDDGGFDAGFDAGADRDDAAVASGKLEGGSALGCSVSPQRFAPFAFGSFWWVLGLFAWIGVRGRRRWG